MQSKTGAEERMGRERTDGRKRGGEKIRGKGGKESPAPPSS